MRKKLGYNHIIRIKALELIRQIPLYNTLREIFMKNLFNTLVLALGLSFASSSVLAGGSDCWGSGADVSGDKMKQEKVEKEV